jgi:hypothetical protein
MRTIVAVSALLVVGWPAAQADEASKLAEARLQPRSETGALPWDVPHQPRLYVRPAFLTPEMPLSNLTISVPRAELPLAERAVRPVFLAADAPLASDRADPRRPEAIVLAAGPLIRLQVVDVAATPPLPTLARPSTERASLADPTAASSLQATLLLPIPVRATPEPFTPVNLPRPFEHRETVRLRQPPAEDATPMVGTPRRP